MSIVVTTPTGNTGHVVAETLLNAGEAVTVLVRDPARLAPTIRDRATVKVGELQDADFVQAATRGADALYWVTVPGFAHPSQSEWYNQVATSASQAVRANAIPYVVTLSSAGADRDDAGLVTLLRVVEDAVTATGTRALHLRPGYFFENFLQQIEPIKTKGAIFAPATGDHAYPMIATADIARAAAHHLQARERTGFLGLHGPADLSYNEAAALLADALARPVAFAQIPAAAVRDQFLVMGASPDFAENYVALITSLGRPGVTVAEPRTPETTTPTTLADWARAVLKPAVEA